MTPEQIRQLLTDDEKRKGLSIVLSDRIENCQEALENLRDKWRRNEAAYASAQGRDEITIAFEQTEELPLAGPKAQRIIDRVTSSFTTIYPAVQIIDESQGGINAEDVERGCDNLAKDAKLDSKVRRVIRDALTTNCGLLWVRPKIGEDGVTGVAISRVHPRDSVVWPVESEDEDSAQTIGHIHYLPITTVKERMENGVYRSTDKVVGGDDPNEFLSGTYDADDRDRPESNTDSRTGFVKIAELVHNHNFGTFDKPKMRRVLITFAVTSSEVLDVQPYGAVAGNDVEVYPEVWYARYRTSEEDGFYADNSWMDTMRVVHDRFNRTVDIIEQGSMMSAFPTVFITGGELGMKSRQIQPGMVYEISGDVKIQVVSVPFNPGALMSEIALLQEIADGYSGISRLGMSQQLPSGTTATAAQGMLQAQTEAKDAYTEALSEGFERTFRLVYMILKAHADDLAMNRPGMVPETVPAMIASMDPRFEVTGRTQASSTQALIQNLMMLMQVAQNDPSIDTQKLVQRIISAIPVPFSLSAIKKETQLTEQGKQIIAAFMQGIEQGLDPIEIAEGIIARLNDGNTTGGLASQQPLNAESVDEEVAAADPELIGGGPQGYGGGGPDASANPTVPGIA